MHYVMFKYKGKILHRMGSTVEGTQFSWKGYFWGETFENIFKY